MSTIIALAMAEIASSFPTAGGLYYWASKLGSPAWGWFTGWFNLIGQIAVTAAIGYGLATFGTALLNFWFDYPNEKEWIYVLYVIFLAAALALNLLRVSITALLNTISAYWHMVGVAVIVLILIVVPDNHQSFSYVFTETVNATGFSGQGFTSLVFWYVFATGLLMAQYTITGFDASAHMAEETRQASRSAAVGMYMSVVASVVFGFILLVAVTFAIPSTQGGIDNLGFLVPWIWSESMSQNWAEALLFICVVAQFFCVTASITSASRMLFAFSRDRAVPGHQLWRRVGANRVPHYAVVAICVASAAVMIPAIWNYLVGYLVGTGIAVIGLYVAFILPVILRFRLGDKFEHGRVVARPALQVDRHHRDRLGRVHHDPVPAAAVQVERAVGRDVHLGGAELRADPRRRSAAPVRRLVGRERQQVVQGPGPHGLGGGARGVGGRSSSPRPRRGSGRASRTARLRSGAHPEGEGARRRPLRRGARAATPGRTARGRGLR